MPKISVIIPCYNAKDYVKTCLDALLKQSFKDFEVCVVDDCSSDCSCKVVKEWSSDNHFPIKIFENTKNSGPSFSRYYGAKESTSEWLAFCDSDDWFDNDFLATMIAKAEEDDCDIVFCGYKNIIGDRVDRHPLYAPTNILSPREALTINVDSLCMSLVKRDIYLNAPQPDLRNGEDMALVPLLIQNSRRIGIVNNELYNYNIRCGSASLVPSISMIENLILSYKHINKYLDNSYGDEKEYICIRNLIYGGLLNLFKLSYNPKRARQILLQFERDYPFWNKNKYIASLPLFKRVFVFLVKARLFILVYIMSLLHKVMLKRF